MPNVPARIRPLLAYLALLLLAAPALGQEAPPPIDRPPAIAQPASPAAATPAPHTREEERGTPLQRAQSLLGLVAFTALCFAFGQLRRPRLPVLWRTIFWGLALQFLFGLLVLNTGAGRWFFGAVNDAVVALLGYSEEGARFVFGNLVKNNLPVGTPLGDPQMGPVLQPASYANAGAFFAFNVLPTIIFFSALSAVAYHSGVMQWIVGGMATVMQRTMGTSGAETLSAAGNVFLGQTEAPLLVKPFISGATRSELMAIMVGGFANIASGVLAAYVGMLKGYFPDIAGHLLSASIISAPASLAVAKLLLPESEPAETAAGVKVEVEKTDANLVDAASRGALEGVSLALNVAGMLIAFIALVAMLNALLGLGGGLVGIKDLSLQKVLGYVMAPMAWLLGIPWEDARPVGSLIGIKTVLNEFVAYLDMADSLSRNSVFIQPRSSIIAAYALCGFANFASVAIQIGGISGMAPNRRSDLSRLGLYAMVGGTISSFMTACVVGILL